MLSSLALKIIRRSPFAWHVPNCVTRLQVIQRAIDVLRAKTYLEIGISNGACFCKINITNKIGVDPLTPRPMVAQEIQKPGVSYFVMTSDAFFERHANAVFVNGVDVVFIDGLHTYAQAYRDCINALKYLNPNGLILMHDCLPKSELEARVAGSLEEATRLNSGMPWNRQWTGDVWKAVLKLRTQHRELKTCVLNCDHGIGVIYKGPNDGPLQCSIGQIEAMTFFDLAAGQVPLLDLRRPSSFRALLNDVTVQGKMLR